MEHSEMQEKIWESQTPDKDGVRSAVAYEFSDEDGGWRLYFSLEGTVVSQAIVGDGSLCLNEAIERAYHKLFDVGCWAWDGENWIDETVHCVLRKANTCYKFEARACETALLFCGTIMAWSTIRPRED